MLTLLKIDRLSLLLLEPTAAPRSLMRVAATSTQIILSWTKVEEQHKNGVIQGYKLFYKAVGQFAVDTTEKMKQINDENTLQTTLIDLEKYVNYSIKIMAFTTKGDGPNSTAISVETDQDGKPSYFVIAVFLLTTFISQAQRVRCSHH